MVCWRDDHARKFGGEYRLAARDPLDSFCRNLKRRHCRKIDNSTRRIRFRQNICDQSQALGEQIFGDVPSQTPADDFVYRVEFKARSHFKDPWSAATQIQHSKSTATLSDLITEIFLKMPSYSGIRRYLWKPADNATSCGTLARRAARHVSGVPRGTGWDA